MQNESEFDQRDSGGEPSNVNPGAASVQAKPGWQTSQGQLTAVFMLVSMVLAAFGYHYTPEQMNGWADKANHLAETVGPLIVGMLTLWQYINSRGKIASNALMANAAIKVAESIGPPNGTIGGTIAEFRDPMAAGFADLDGWKDPHRYEQLAQVAKILGVPGADKVDKAVQTVHPADLITGILGMFKKPKK